MPDVQEATEALRVTLRKKGVERHVQDAFDNLASCLVLLNSSSPSVQMIRKLCAVLRQPFLPLYNACLQPALQLSYSVLSTVLGRLCDAHNAEDEGLRTAWDATAEVILSGVLDFLDQQDGVNVESHDAVWDALCHIICEFFFLDSNRGLPAFNISLCLSAYNTLTETAAMQSTIRNSLRQRAVLGGERLGAAISATRDYLLLEALLILFARLLPPTLNTSQGKLRRVKFVTEVFGSPKLFKCNEELLDIMRKTSDIHWDNVSAQIIDVLARSDVTFPQPFAINEIHVCGRVFPQPLATDRLIMDRRSFLVNIVIENDDPCESLQVPYSYIRTITLDNSEKTVPKGKVLIMIYLTSPPLVADVEMKSPDASCLHAKFLLQDDSVGRFMEALRRRGVGKLSFLNPLTRVERKRKGVSIGSGFKFTNDSSPILPSASFEGKVQHVNQVYKTEIEESTTLQAIPLSDADSLPTSGPKPLVKNLIPELLQPKDVPPVVENTRLIPHTNEVPMKPSAKTTHLFGNDDELSEISEFEVDIDSHFASKRAAGKVSAPSSGGLKPTKHRNQMQTNADSSSISGGIMKSSDCASKSADHTEGVARSLLQAGKSQLIPDSPMFGASSVTQIDVSPKLLSDADTLLAVAGTEAVDCLPVASQNFVAASILRSSDVNECGPCDMGLTSFAKDTPRYRVRPFIPTSGANQEVHSHSAGKNTSVPPKTAGSRRKREPVETSSKPIVEFNDECPHPHKKIRGGRVKIEEDKVKSNVPPPGVIPTSRVKRYPKTAKLSPPEIDQKALDSDELPELKPTPKGARRSSRIKKRQAAATGGTRSNGKTHNGNQSVSQSVSERSVTQATGVEICHRTQSVLSSQAILPLVASGESPSPNTNSQAPWLEPSNAEDIILGSGSEMNLTQRSLEGNSIPACAASQPIVTPTKPREDLGIIEEAASDMMELNQKQIYVKHEEIIDDQQVVSDAYAIDEVSGVREVVDNSVTLQENEDPVEPSRPTMESTPRKEFVTIDLTTDDSPIRENSEPHKASGDAVRSAADIQMKLQTPDLSDGITTTLVPSPRNRHRSVTFASPIDYVLNKKSQSKTQANTARSHQPPSPSESGTLSPLRIPTRTVDARREPPGRVASRATLQNSKILQASVYHQTSDETEIQDIVDVLDEIQAVIIKGISDRFRDIKKGVLHSRGELIQQVLDELRCMVVENAQYFNELLGLEEDYYKSCKAIIRCWEELIDYNDGIAIHFQNALEKHDQHVSVKTFPKSLVPIQPVFTLNRRRANT